MQKRTLLLQSVALFFGCLSFFTSTAQENRFIDVTSELGLSYSYGVGLEYQYGFVSFNGGFTFCDFDNDGLDDLAYGSPIGQPLYIYKNDSTTFNAFPITSLYTELGLSSALSWVDYDNDGDKDIYITNIPPGANKLYQNDGAFNFTDVTLSSGIWIGNNVHTYSVSWGDYNLDGWLDCYVINRDLDALNLGLPGGSRNFLLKSNGDGTFTEVAEAAGVLDTSGLGYAVVFIDYDKDGWPDIYVGNDKDTCNKLYKNNGDGTFADVSDPNSTGRCISSMGIGVGDYDHNGYFDFYVTNGPGGNLFLQNNGDDTFSEIGDSLGITVNHNGWGTIFEDFDNDGYEDIFAVNGGVNILDWNENRLFYNQGDLTFVEDTTDSIGIFPYHSYGASMGDWNHDGYPDIGVMNVGGDPMKLWQNKGGDNNWIKFHFKGTLSNADAIGTYFEVWTNGMRQIRYTMCGDSYSSQFSNNYIVGLAQNETVDSVVIKWPSGVSNNIYDLSVNQHFFIIEDTSSSVINCAILYYPDQDGDGYGDANAAGVANCSALTGMVPNQLDCDDQNSAIHPDASESCDGFDNDCNGLTDDNLPLYTYYEDVDNDGFGNPMATLDTCSSTLIDGFAENDLDCNDNDENIGPDGIEIPNNGIDEDCDGEDLVVGVNNLSHNQTIKLFPNPVRDLLTIDYDTDEDLILRIFDAQGKALEQMPLLSNREKATIDFSTFPHGIYWVMVSENGAQGNFLEKVVRITN